MRLHSGIPTGAHGHSHVIVCRSTFWTLYPSNSSSSICNYPIFVDYISPHLVLVRPRRPLSILELTPPSMGSACLVSAISKPQWLSYYLRFSFRKTPKPVYNLPVCVRPNIDTRPNNSVYYRVTGFAKDIRHRQPERPRPSPSKIFFVQRTIFSSSSAFIRP